MKAVVYSLEGQKVSEVELPKAFESEVDKNLIKRAVLAIRSARMQVKGPNPRSGRQTTAEYIGARHYPNIMRSINVGRARRPRTKEKRALLYGRVAGISGVVKGPKAHAPKLEKKLWEKINKKEKKHAMLSAIAATAVKELVKARGHKFDERFGLPLVVEDKFEELDKTKKVRKVLEALKVWQDVERAKKARKVRSGKGRKRGRKYKKRKSILIVAVGSKIAKAARNIEGVDIVQAKNLNAEVLAPGCLPGRLAVFTEKALKELNASA